jgi:hypothetical protein
MDSVLFGSRLLQETLFLIATGICASAEEICNFMRRSYAGTLCWNQDKTAAEAMKADVSTALSYCIEHELIVPSTPLPTPDPSQEGNKKGGITYG